jgi:Fe-S cluster biosynthesis and repair protein YggX
MAKGDKKDVASAKSAAAKTRKTQQVRVNETRTKMASPKASRKLESKSAKTFNKGSKADIKAGSPIREKGTTKDWETRSGRMTNNPKLSAMDSRTTIMKNGSPTVKGGSSSVSATKPSVASKANAKNKMKAQGAKIGSSPTSGYGKKGKK